MKAVKNGLELKYTRDGMARSTNGLDRPKTYFAHVWTDKKHTEKEPVQILSYEQREHIKGYYKLDGHGHRTDYSHWQRFLEQMDAKVGPSFEEYIEWKRAYPGWGYGTLTRGSMPTGMQFDPNANYPMNAYHN